MRVILAAIVGGLLLFLWGFVATSRRERAQGEDAEVVAEAARA